MTARRTSVSAKPVTLRAGRTNDIDRPVDIENSCFTCDRLSRRNFHWMLNRANADLIVAEQGGIVIGYVLVLYHQGTSLARLYSMAVDPKTHSKGIGRRLLAAAEEAAELADSAYMRLEVRTDNAPAIHVYETSGYRFLEIKPEYYEDGTDARRYEKRIRTTRGRKLQPVPFYAQHTDFTCGPAALMMAMGRLNRRMKLDEALELRIWREATTIFMTSGHGGCGPHGLALAAYRRGFDVTLHLNYSGALFIEGVRDPEKKRVIELVQRDFENEIASTGIRITNTPLTLADLAAAQASGGVVIALISAYQLSQTKAPHWVALTGLDDHYFYLHDPEIDNEHGKTEFDCSHVPIMRAAFDRMTRFGSNRVSASLVIAKR